MLVVVMRWWLTFIFSPTLIWADISYTVDFRGLEDSRALKAIKAGSELIQLQSHPPASPSALRFRMESDIPQLTAILQAYGYYEAEVKMDISERLGAYYVEVTLSPGPVYRLVDYAVRKDQEDHDLISPDLQTRFCQLGLVFDQQTVSTEILAAETKVVQLLGERGYPLCRIVDRSVVADGREKTVRVTLTVETGPLCTFGPYAISGNTCVKNAFIEQKICWERGEIYNRAYTQNLEKELLSSGLFCSAKVTHSEQASECGELPLLIELMETKHRSISAGASYQKTFGAGGTLEWENRNIGGMGRKLSIQAEVTQRSHAGIATYEIPNFWKPQQDLLFQAEASRESITAYKDQSYDLLTRMDWQVNDRFFLSTGAQGTYLIVSSSVDNGHFWLAELPIKMRLSNVCDFLNPTQGATLDLFLLPSLSVKKSTRLYGTSEISLSTYWPLTKQELFLLAQKITVGTIFSNDLEPVPVPRRFLGGSEENLRGYKYLTVSPLVGDHKPTGGRLALFYSLEPRLRFGDFGLVPFFDLGNVSRNLSFKGQWRKSIGLGFRYFSFLGPLRVDVAFPLDRRKHLDPFWWIFASVGQAF